MNRIEKALQTSEQRIKIIAGLSSEEKTYLKKCARLMGLDFQHMLTEPHQVKILLKDKNKGKTPKEAIETY